MLHFIVYLVFIVSAAMTAGGIILASRLRNRNHNEIFSALLYFQVFIFTFGFYGIWGQVLIKAYLSTYITTELLDRFTDISMLLGLPFLVFAWLMLIRLACGLSGRECRNWFIVAFLVLNFTLIVGIGYLIAGTSGIKPALLLKIYYITMNFTYSLASAYLVHFSYKPVLNRDKGRIISASLVTIMILQCFAVYFYENQPFIGLLFILTFFVGNAFMPVYLSYGAEVPSVSQEVPEKNLTLDEFCSLYDVSPREKDIVREICNGLSNKEISDKLFISLQTVKDHTHRIYIKTNVKSRAQLMSLVKAQSKV